MKPLDILYEDNHLLVAVKPCNLPSQADASGDDDMLTLLKAYIKEKYNKPGAVYLGLVHRLDRPAGGVMVFARTSKAAARLSAQMKAGQFRKKYRCVCQGTPPSGALQDWLLKDTRANRVRVVPANTPGAKEARLEVAPLDMREGLTLCAVALDTGRSHQIRVQLAHAGAPLYGDQRYNAGAKPGQQLALWSYQLGFCHPTTGEVLVFQARPQGEIWDNFPHTLM